MADPQGKNRLQEFKYKGKDQDVSRQRKICVKKSSKFTHRKNILSKKNDRKNSKPTKKKRNNGVHFPKREQ